MKLIKAVLITLTILFCAGLLLAQEPPKQPPKPTEIRGVPLGWTLAEFEAKSNVRANCNKSCKKVLDAAEAGKETWFEAGNKFKLCFVGTKLVEMEVGYNDFDEFATLAIEKFGKPVFIEKQTLQNSYGTQFQAGLAQWNLPDGAVISARESVQFTSSLGYIRYTTVNVRTAERFKEFNSKFNRPEPKL